MKLSELLKPWIDNIDEDREISGLQNDSRRLKAGDLFFAYPGKATDGRLHISQAIEAKAAVIVYEPENWPDAAPSPALFNGIAFPGLTRYLAAIVSRFYGDPSHNLAVTGITGTNGKTTIAYQLAQAHNLLGQRAAYIGTIGQGLTTQLQPLANTTPDALALQSLLNHYEQDQIKQVCMEVSSHALTQNRVDNIAFNQAIFTNLTHDHLDYHGTMEAYALAKASLFACPSLSVAIINRDDPKAQQMIDSLSSGCRLLTYGIKANCDVRAKAWEVSMAGTQIDIQSPWGQHLIHINALGFFNIYNALAIFSSLLAADYAVDAVVEVMKRLQPAPGRMEVVIQKPCVIVDYAHTPDALENVLATLHKVKKGRILVVFGCGGDRDKTKRPMMGKIAGDYADIAIITSDNPRSEDPQKIIDDIEPGFSANSHYQKIVDRKQAIIKALSLANEEDIVLVAGKGHENYQQIGQVCHHFSDQEIIRCWSANQ